MFRSELRFADRELASTEAEHASIEACLSIAAAEVPSPEAELASIEADLSIPARELPSRQAELPSKVALHASPSSRQPMPRPDRPTRDREWSASGSGVDREARNCASGQIKLGTKEGLARLSPLCRRARSHQARGRRLRRRWLASLARLDATSARRLRRVASRESARETNAERDRCFEFTTWCSMFCGGSSRWWRRSRSTMRISRGSCGARRRACCSIRRRAPGVGVGRSGGSGSAREDRGDVGESRAVRRRRRTGRGARSPFHAHALTLSFTRTPARTDPPPAPGEQ